MKNALTTLLLLLCVTVKAGAQAAEEGIKYTSPEGRYSVTLPKEPKLSTKDTTTPMGAKFKQFRAGVFDGTSLRAVEYFDYGADTVYSLDKALDGIASAVNGTLDSKRDISLGVYPGKEVSLTLKDVRGMELRSRMRFYEVGRRVYYLQCMTTKAHDGPEFALKCAKFFDSFKVETAQ